MNGDTLVVKCILLLIANFADANYFGQFFCLWSMKNLKYCSNSWFILSVWPSVWEWNTVDSFILISKMLFNSLIISTANCGLLSDTICQDRWWWTLFYFLFSFLFYFTLLYFFSFLFLEQLGLGLISHAVTSVTNWWHSHKTNHETWEKGIEGTRIKWRHTAWATHAGLM